MILPSILLFAIVSSSIEGGRGGWLGELPAGSMFSVEKEEEEEEEASVFGSVKARGFLVAQVDRNF